MAQPTRSDVHVVDVPLSNISIAYIQKHTNFIATQVFPVVPVEKQSDRYYTYTQNDWFRDEARVRGAGTESAGSGYNLSSTTYYCDPFAIHKDIPDQVRANADSTLDLDREAAEFCAQRLLVRRERQWVTDYFASSVWGTDVTPSNLWSDYNLSTPLSDVETGKKTILSNTGFEANTLVLGYEVFSKLRQHPDIRDIIKYTSPDSITEMTLANAFGVERVLVAKAVYASNAENETAVYAFTHGKHALLCYAAPSPSLLAPSAGYVFSWTGVSNGLGLNVATSNIRAPLIKADRIEAEEAYDMKVVGTGLGYFFASVVA